MTKHDASSCANCSEKASVIVDDGTAWPMCRPCASAALRIDPTLDTYGMVGTEPTISKKGGR